MNKNPGKILYWLHWFPAISETFILREILELQNLGEELDIFAVNRSPDKISHPEVSLFKGKVFNPQASVIHYLNAHLYWIGNKPSVYFGFIFTILASFGHLKTFTVSMRVFCKAVYGAYILRGQNYRHIHSHFGNAPSTGAWIVSKLLDVPFSMTTHAIDIFIPDKLLERKMLDSKFVATISDFNMGYLLTKYKSLNAEKVKIIRCGLNLSEFKFREPSPAGSPSKIVSVGRFVEKKGFDYLIRAIKIILNTGKKVELTIIGGGALMTELQNLVDELGIKQNVKLVGALSNDEVKRIMGDADMFVLASVMDSRGDMDGIPVVLMESLALGVPSISTEISGIPELIKPFETGLLVPQKDSKSLADAIRLYLAENDLRKRLVPAGRRLVESEYNISKNTKKLSELFGSACSLQAKG